MIIVLFVLGASAFILGFLSGLSQRKTKKTFIEQKANAQIEKLRKEYENFLSYDGTEQI